MAVAQSLIAFYLLPVLCLTTAFPSGNDASLLISVNPERQQLVDSLGRERFFHGTNVVVKHFPFHPTLEGYSNDSFSEVDMKILQDLGLNVIRLGELLLLLPFICILLLIFGIYGVSQSGSTFAAWAVAPPGG